MTSPSRGRLLLRIPKSTWDGVSTGKSPRKSHTSSKSSKSSESSESSKSSKNSLSVRRKSTAKSTSKSSTASSSSRSLSTSSIKPRRKSTSVSSPSPSSLKKMSSPPVATRRRSASLSEHDQQSPKKARQGARQGKQTKVKAHELVFPPVGEVIDCSQPKFCWHSLPVTFDDDDVDVRFELGDYTGKSIRAKRLILSLPKNELMGRVRNLQKPPSFIGGIKEEYPDHFQQAFEWVNKYPAWYLRKRLFAQLVREWIAEHKNRRIPDQETLYDDWGRPIREKTHNFVTDSKFLPAYRNWAPPVLDKSIRDQWKDLTADIFEDGQLRIKKIHIRDPSKYNGWLQNNNTFFEVRRPPAPGYEEWENKELDDKDTMPLEDIIDKVKRLRHEQEKRQKQLEIQTRETEEAMMKVLELCEDNIRKMAERVGIDEKSIKKAFAMLYEEEEHEEGHATFKKLENVISPKALLHTAITFNSITNRIRHGLQHLDDEEFWDRKYKMISEIPLFV